MYMDGKNMRRILWMGKLAFPKIDTRRTRVVFVPYPTAVVAADDGKDRIELKRWGYKSRRHAVTIVFMYYEDKDVLIVKDSSFRLAT
jgi:hypothetical protein